MSGTSQSRSRVAVALLIAGLLVSACGRTRQLTPPAVAVPEHFSDSGVSTLPDRWWTTFADPGLNQAIETALGRNFDLAQSWNRLDEATALARKQGAALQPQLDASLAAGHRWQRAGGHESDSAVLSLGLAASYEIDLWGRIAASDEAARLQVAAAGEQVQTAAISLSASIAVVWYRLAAAQERLRLITAQEADQRTMLALVAIRFRTGQASATAIYRQRQLLANSSAERELAARDARLLEHQLAVLLGHPPRHELGLPAPRLVEPPPLPASGLPITLLDRRPDLRRAWLAVRIADRGVAVAIADRYPRISLGLDASTDGEALDDLFDGWLVRLLGNLLAPLLDGGRRAAEVERQEALLAGQLNAYAAAVLAALREVEDALARERHQRRYQTRLAAQLSAARATLDGLRTRFRKGQSSGLEVLEAQTSVHQLEGQAITAANERLASRIALARALAGGWPLERPDHDPPPPATTTQPATP